MKYLNKKYKDCTKYSGFAGDDCDIINENYNKKNIVMDHCFYNFCLIMLLLFIYMLNDNYINRYNNISKIKSKNCKYNNKTQNKLKNNNKIIFKKQNYNFYVLQQSTMNGNNLLNPK